MVWKTMFIELEELDVQVPLDWLTFFSPTMMQSSGGYDSSNNSGGRGGDYDSSYNSGGRGGGYNSSSGGRVGWGMSSSPDKGNDFGQRKSYGSESFGGQDTNASAGGSFHERMMAAASAKNRDKSPPLKLRMG